MKKIIFLLAIVGVVAAADVFANRAVTCVRNATGVDVSGCATNNTINRQCTISRGVPAAIFEQCRTDL